MTFSDGSKSTFTDDWRWSEDPCAKVDSLLAVRSSNFRQGPRGQRISGKRSTLHEPFQESKEARRPGVELSLRDSQPGVNFSSRPVSLSVEDTFKERLNKSKEGDGSTVCARSLVNSSDHRRS